jgi:capsular polysaccharide biosynthesis protein
MEALELLRLPPRPVYAAREVAGDWFRSITLLQIDDAEAFLSPAYRAQLGRLTREVVEAHGSLGESDSLYVSRSLSALRQPGYRVMRNEQQVEEAVRAHGFTVVHPETLSLREQIRTFAGVRFLLGPSGSGMLNAMFAERPERIVDIETFHSTVRQHAKLYASCGAAYSFLFAAFADDEDRPPMLRASVCPEDLLSQAIAWLRGEF